MWDGGRGKVAELGGRVMVQNIEHRQQHVQSGKKRRRRDGTVPLHLTAAQSDQELLALLSFRSRLTLQVPHRYARHATNQQTPLKITATMTYATKFNGR